MCIQPSRSAPTLPVRDGRALPMQDSKKANDKPGLEFRITSAIADSRVNLRGVSGFVVGRKFVAYLGFDGKADADKAARALKALDSTKKSGSTKRVSSR